MIRSIPSRTILSLAISAALLGLKSGAVYAETASYNGTQAEYGQLAADPRDSSLRALLPTSATSDNMVNVTDTDDLSATDTYVAPDTVYGTYQYSGSGAVNNNTVSITGGAVSGNVYGAYLNQGASSASGNTVILSGGTIGGDVYGTYKTQDGGSISGSTIMISADAQVIGSVYGTYKYAGSSNLSDTLVSIDGGTIGGNVYGVYVYAGTSNITDNSVVISGDAQIAGNVYGIYRYASTGTLSGNSLSITGGTISGTVYGEYTVAGTTDVTSNSVTLSGGTVTKDVVGGFKYQGSGDITNNVVILSDGANVSGSVLGGQKQGGSGAITGNTVTVTDSTVGGGVYGAFRSSNYYTNMSNNSVSVTGSTIKGSIYGGNISNATGSVTNNSVSVAGSTQDDGTLLVSTVGGNIYGGYGTTGATTAVSGNTVTIADTAIAGSIYGGYKSGDSSSSVTGNSITISGMTSVAGNVVGGYSGLSSATGNSVTITSGTITGGVYGGLGTSSSSQDIFTGNTLAVANATDTTISVGSVQNFENLNFDLSNLSATTVALAATGDVTFGSTSLNKKSTINITGVDSASALGRIFISSGGTMSGDYIATVGGVETGVDYLTYNVSIDDNNLVLDYMLSWYNSDTAAAHGTFTLTNADNVFTVGAILADNTDISGTNAAGWNGTSLTKAGDGTLILSADNTYTGGTTISAGTLQIGNGGTTGSVVGDIANAGELVFDRSDALTYAGVVSGTGSLTQAGTGTLILTGENTYTGGTTISSGTLQIGSGGTTGSLVGDVANSGILAFNRSDDVTYAGGVSGTGSLAQDGTGTLILTGENTYTGGTTISGGTLQIGDGGTAGSVVGDIANDGSLVFNRSDDVTYASVVSGTGSLTKLGDNTLTLSGSSTYSGGTTITSGTLALASVTGAGSGDITNNSRLAFTGAQGSFSNAVSGSGDVAVTTGSDVKAESTVTAGDVSVDATSRLTLADGIVWQASDGFSNAGTLVLSSLSQLTGDVINSGTLALSDEQYVTAYIDGSLTNSGAVVLNPTSTSAGNTLIITGDYVGETGSSLSVGAILAGDDSLTDKVSILGNTSGSSTVYIANENGSGAQTLEGIRIIAVGGNSDAVFTQGNRAVAGLYDYSLIKKGSDWYLTSYVTPTEPTTPTDPTTPTEPIMPTSPQTPVGVVRQVRPEAAGYAANLQAANSLFVLSLHDRVGETVYRDTLTGESRTTSLWVRNEGGRTSTSMADGQNKNHSNRYVLQLGGDVLTLSTGEQGALNLGIMGGYANLKGQTDNTLTGYYGRNSLYGYGTGLYGTWRQNAEVKGGLYADSWLQYNWFRNTVKGQDLVAERYRSQGMTASLETGYDWQAGSWHTESGLENSLWLRPHAQAVWMGVKADNHSESNGTQIQGTGHDNLHTTVGLRAYLNGKSVLDRDTGREFQPYVEANWVHNTSQYGVRMNGVEDEMQGTRNALELKAGVEAKLSSRLSVWGGVSGLSGSHSYSDVGAALGGRFNF